MIPLIRRLLYALLWDELAARRWARGALMWLGGAGITVMAVGWDVASKWTAREWVGRLAFAAVLGAAGMVTAGERNPREQQLPPGVEGPKR